MKKEPIGKTILQYDTHDQSAQYICLCGHLSKIAITSKAFQCEGCQLKYLINGSGWVYLKPFRFTIS